MEYYGLVKKNWALECVKFDYITLQYFTLQYFFFFFLSTQHVIFLGKCERVKKGLAANVQKCSKDFEE